MFLWRGIGCKNICLEQMSWPSLDKKHTRESQTLPPCISLRPPLSQPPYLSPYLSPCLYVWLPLFPLRAPLCFLPPFTRKVLQKTKTKEKEQQPPSPPTAPNYTPTLIDYYLYYTLRVTTSDGLKVILVTPSGFGTVLRLSRPTRRRL